jgi:hypothetical protein
MFKVGDLVKFQSGWAYASNFNTWTTGSAYVANIESGLGIVMKIEMREMTIRQLDGGSGSWACYNQPLPNNIEVYWSGSKQSSYCSERELKKVNG